MFAIATSTSFYVDNNGIDLINEHVPDDFPESLLCPRFTAQLLTFIPWNHGNQWMAWDVLEGHAGWRTADLLEKHLLPFVRHSLGQVRSASGEGSVSDKLFSEPSQRDS